MRAARAMRRASTPLCSLSAISSRKDEDRWETRMNSHPVKISQFRLLLAWVVVER